MKKKSALQKFSNVLGILSFISAVVCAVFLYFKVQELGMQNTISASFLASIFFFSFIGFLFLVIANTNVPSFRVDGVVDISLKSDVKK
ncbi:MAG: hypothetical protein KAG56_08350 [Sulfurovaceae bacterium]|nr:hypothetical protein [Sulfurovaceae bacterium]